jgi:hypothetical protein
MKVVSPWYTCTTSACPCSSIVNRCGPKGVPNVVRLRCDNIVTTGCIEPYFHIDLNNWSSKYHSLPTYCQPSLVLAIILVRHIVHTFPCQAHTSHSAIHIPTPYPALFPCFWHYQILSVKCYRAVLHLHSNSDTFLRSMDPRAHSHVARIPAH